MRTSLALRDHLDNLGVTVWFDGLTITPGKSQALQMDKGLQKARGFETARDSVEVIAQKIAAAVLGDGPALSTAA